MSNEINETRWAWATRMVTEILILAAASAKPVPILETAVTYAKFAVDHAGNDGESAMAVASFQQVAMAARFYAPHSEVAIESNDALKIVLASFYLKPGNYEEILTKLAAELGVDDTEAERLLGNYVQEGQLDKVNREPIPAA